MQMHALSSTVPQINLTTSMKAGEVVDWLLRGRWHRCEAAAIRPNPSTLVWFNFAHGIRRSGKPVAPVLFAT